MKKILIYFGICLLVACATISNDPNISFINNETISNPPAYGGLLYGTEIVHVSGGKTFTWGFECDNGDCAYGQFVGGEYWVAPVNAGGAVSILSVTPEGEDNGLEINPLAGNKQGLLSCQVGSYDVSKNLMTQLPFQVRTNASLIKADKREDNCGARAISGCCIDSYDVLTVLESIPINGGADQFRPGFAGTNKKLYSVNDFDWTLLPEHTEVNETGRQSAFFDIENRWKTPFYDHLSSELGVYSRAFVPQAVLPTFGSKIASSYLNDLISVFGDNVFDEKEYASYALVQRGIDLYSSWKVGVDWPSAGGSRVGRKPAMAFLAALVLDDKVKRDVANMASNNGNETQEDGQIRIVEKSLGGAGVAVWGDVCTEKVYWSQLFFEQKYVGASNIKMGSGDNKKRCRDPYGWIDGPAGEPGMGYFNNGTLFAFSVAQKLMPELGIANNDPELQAFTSRVMSEGVHTYPDKCAPPDENESELCRPYKAGAPGCQYYGVTWGPDSENSGQCILNGTAGVEQNGRFPHLHGRKVERFTYKPLIVSKLEDLEVVKRSLELVTEETSNNGELDGSVEVMVTAVENTIIEHISGTKLFTWEFNCGGEECITGQFINGEYWVAPQIADSSVVLVNVSPKGEENGLEANPTLTTKQGLLSCEIKSYSPALNIMNQLPFSAQPNTSLIKADLREEGCRLKDANGNPCCIDSYDVVTVLDFIPEDNGASIFRPGFSGDAKKYYSVKDFDWAKIPKDTNISNSKNLKNYSDTVTSWTTPFFDHMMTVIGDKGRAFSPVAVLPDYGATHAANYLDSLLGVFTNDSFDVKSEAVYAITQRGIDLFASWEEGIRWPDGAGQQMGRKPPMAFFAALVNDEHVKSSVKNMAYNNSRDTQEDGQINFTPKEYGGGAVPVWGSTGSACNENNYWQQLLAAQNYAGGSGEQWGAGDNRRGCGDPYGWIDGPAGYPGSFYMACCSTGGFTAFVLAQKIMPALGEANNDPILIEYVRRVRNEGVRTLPDVCAPPDPRELRTCAAYKAGAPGCEYYKVTWGPDPKKPGQCIVNATGQNGRFPHLNNIKMEKIYNEPLISQELWSKYIF